MSRSSISSSSAAAGLRRSVFRDIALVLACALFLGAELGLRLAARSGGSSSLIAGLRDAAPQGYYPPPHVFDPECGYLYQPGHQGRFRRTDYDARLVISEQGFHGPSFPAEKPPGVFRVALIGDSLLAANQVAVDETWAVQLQRRLSPIDDRPIELLNLGVDGYLPWNILKLLKTRVLAFEPDAVILWCDYTHLNTGAERYRMVSGDGVIWEASDPDLLRAHVALESRRAPSLRELIPRVSYVARLCNHLAGKVGQSNIQRLEEPSRHRHDPLQLHEATYAACARADVPFAVVYRRSAPPPDEDPYRAIGVPTWSDAPVISDFDALTWPNDAHFDVRGNTVYAARVAPVFQDVLETLAATKRYTDRGDTARRQAAHVPRKNGYNGGRWSPGNTP